MRLNGFWVLAAAMAVAFTGQAQEIPAEVVGAVRPRLKRARNPGEKEAAAALGSAGRPAERQRRAEAFLRRYPESWLLADAYEAAAKAALQRGDLRAGVRWSRRSLELAPENGGLLAPLAVAYLLWGQMGEAQRCAKLALEYLERYRPPVGEPWSLWVVEERRIRAVSLAVLARAKAATADGKGKTPGRAPVELAAAVAAEPGVAKLVFGLKRRVRWPEGSTVGETGRTDDLPRKIVPTMNGRTEEEPPAQYAGSAACQPCHKEEHKNWGQTGMAQMLRHYDPDVVRGEFERPEFADATTGEVVRPWVETGRHGFDILGADGVQRTYEVEYVIGSKWQQAYTVRGGDGRIHVVPVQYDLRLRRWVNYWAGLDPAHESRADPRRFHTWSLSTDYLWQCAPCHTSQFGRIEDSPSLVATETGVNCEMCHGPSEHHAQDPHEAGKRPLDPPVEFGKIDARDYVAICTPCHAQTMEPQPGPNGETNYTGLARRFWVTGRQVPLGEFHTTALYKDGRLRQTTFIVESLLRTACYRGGKLHCGYCHSPHSPGAARNSRSLKYPEEPNRMCVVCHPRYQTEDALESHSRHKKPPATKQCISCHMPKIMNGLGAAVRTHTIDDLPRADTAARFGVSESPNACLASGCHANQSIGWLRRELGRWSRKKAR